MRQDCRIHRFKYFHSVISLVIALNLFAALVCAGEVSRPGRGNNPGGAYSVSDIETIDLQSGNLMLNIPLAGLPSGRGNSGGAVTLHYNSKLYNMNSQVADPETGGGFYATLEPSEDGGWKYSYKYKIKLDSCDENKSK